MFFKLVFSFIVSSMSLFATTYYNTASTGTGIQLKVINTDTGFESAPITGSVVGTDGSIKLYDSKIFFSKAPKINPSKDTKVCIFKWYTPGVGSGSVQVQNENVSKPFGLLTNCNGCSYNYYLPYVRVNADCSISVNNNGSYSRTSYTGIVDLYTFNSPSGWDNWTAAWNAPEMSVYLNNWNIATVLPIGIYSTPSSGANLGYGGYGSQTVYFSGRVRASHSLDCPNEYYENGVFNWMTSQPGNRGVFVGYPVSTAVSETDFRGIAVQKSVNYLTSTQLSNRVCNKSMCPQYFTADPLQPNTCYLNIKRPLIINVPTQLYLPYPTTPNEIFQVPDLSQYFQPSYPTNLLQYEIVAKNGVDVSVISQPMGKKGLKIVVSPNATMTSMMASNQIYNGSFVLRVKENIKNAVYNLNNMVLVTDLVINVKILSSTYNATSKSFWRCDALTKD